MPHDPSPLQPSAPLVALTAPQHNAAPRAGQGRPISLKALSLEPITTTEALADACSRLSKHPFVTVDTEFLRESTYYPLLCIAQMASPEEAVVVDALAKGIDLAPFYDLMTNERVLKVFHAARQDIEIVWHQAQRIPHPVFDTQVAAMVLGYGDSISYDQLVQRITGDSLDKSHRFTDWSRRPLSAAQFAYAVSDVTHLRDVYRALAADLERRGRADWVDEEMTVLTSPDTYRADPETAWERLKTRARKPKELAVLVEVAAWREREAQSRDVPRGRVLKDEVLGDIAIHAPTTPERLASLRSLPRGFERSKSGQDILDAVQRGLARDPKTLPRLDRPRQTTNTTATIELLKVLLRMTSEQHGVAAKVIATVDDLERIASDDSADVAALKGWRRDMFGEQALALKHGRISLAIERGRVVAVARG
jgi:ribonuclease D